MLIRTKCNRDISVTEDVAHFRPVMGFDPNPVDTTLLTGFHCIYSKFKERDDNETLFVQ